MKSLQSHSSRLSLLSWFLGILLIAGAAQAQTNLYPIALSAAVVNSVNAGDTILSVMNGAGHGNFGWLTWTGDNSETALATSLSGAGNASTYTNPDNANDHDLSVGDWVRGKLGVSNSIGIRNALDDLQDTDIMVPVWDQVRGSGSTLAYHISGFARVHIEGYRLPGQNRISVTFLGVFDNPAGNPGDDDGGPGV